MFLQLLLYLTIVTSSRLSLCDPDQFNKKQSYIKDEEPSRIQDQNTQQLGTSISLKSITGVNILSNLKPKKVDTSNIQENKEKFMKSSSIQKEAFKSFRIQKVSVESFKSSSIQENKDAVTNASLILTKTDDKTNSRLHKQTDGDLITLTDTNSMLHKQIAPPSLTDIGAEEINVQKRDVGYNMLQYTPIRIPESEAEAKHSYSVQEKTIQVINSSNMNERLAKTKEIFKCQYGTKTTLDMEARTVCAKGPGEVCGGRDHVYGRCAEGLHCSNCGRCEGCSLLTWVCYYDDHCYY